MPTKPSKVKRARWTERCLRCANRASGRVAYRCFPPLCEEHVRAFIQAVAWHLHTIDGLSVRAVAARVTRDGGASAIRHHVREKETRLRVFRNFDCRPFMKRLRAAGALPPHGAPILHPGLLP